MTEGGGVGKTPAASQAETLVAGVLAQDVRAIARLMRAADDRQPSAVEALRRLYAHTGRAFVVGVTGNPGAGKSTVVDALTTRLRARGERVGIVAVDPSSPFSGGAVLGDRIRMQRHALDEDVFIRSLATRGQMGGLSRSTADVVSVLDAAAFGVIFIETVGVGQDETDVMSLADTTVVVTVPGLGDEVQALKAGLLEIADVLLVNKADHEGADRAVRDLTTMLGLRNAARGEVELLTAVATRGEGMDALWAAIERHRDRQRAGDGWQVRRLAQAQRRVQDIVAEGIRHQVDQRAALAGGVEALAAHVAARRRDPYTVADEILASDGHVSAEN